MHIFKTTYSHFWTFWSSESKKLRDRLIHMQTLLLCAGNDILHLLTSNTRQRLRVDLADFEGNTAYAEYDYFIVDSERSQYRLVALGGYNGTAGQYDMKTWTEFF